MAGSAVKGKLIAVVGDEVNVYSYLFSYWSLSGT